MDQWVAVLNERKHHEQMKFWKITNVQPNTIPLVSEEWMQRFGKEYQQYDKRSA